MHENRLQALLSQVANGDLAPEQAVEKLRTLPFESIGFAHIDHHRQLRQGLPEVIFCPGKTAAQILEIAGKLRERNELVLATRASIEQAKEIEQANSGGRFFEDAQTIIWGKIPPTIERLGKVTIVTAGTADLPVAREAQIVLEACAISTELIVDVGVAGLHRVLSHLASLREARVCIVMAGMDGVLASVLGGLLDCPVIACPTSIGYGASFDGLAALLTMLNSCAAGLSVVNIDNGFGAAVAAFRIMNRREQAV